MLGVGEVAIVGMLRIFVGRGRGFLERYIDACS